MNQMMSEKRPKSAIETQIEENLRRVYRQKLDEEIPSRISELLKQLREQESTGDKESGR